MPQDVFPWDPVEELAEVDAEPRSAPPLELRPLQLKRKPVPDRLAVFTRPRSESFVSPPQEPFVDVQKTPS